MVINWHILPPPLLIIGIDLRGLLDIFLSLNIRCCYKREQLAVLCITVVVSNIREWMFTNQKNILFLQMVKWFSVAENTEVIWYSPCKDHISIQWRIFNKARKLMKMTDSWQVSGYDTKLYLMVRLQFWRVWITPSLPLLPGPL